MRLETKWYILMQIVGAAMQRRLSTALIALLLLTAMPISVSADETKDIPTNASETGVHNSLVAALTHAGLASTLSGDGPFTILHQQTKHLPMQVSTWRHLTQMPKMQL